MSDRMTNYVIEYETARKSLEKQTEKYQGIIDDPAVLAADKLKYMPYLTKSKNTVSMLTELKAILEEQL